MFLKQPVTRRQKSVRKEDLMQDLYVYYCWLVKQAIKHENCPEYYEPHHAQIVKVKAVLDARK